MAGQETRYCRSQDGTSIAYTVYGQGTPALLFMPGWGITFQMEQEFADGTAFYDRLSKGRLVIRYDLRGIGASSREVTDYSAGAHVEDAEAVVAALKLEHYDLFGCAFDAPLALLLAHQHPEEVRRIVLWAPYSRGDYAPRDSTRAISDLCRANWPLATRTIADIIGVPENNRGKWARMLREATSPDVAISYIESRYDVDVSGIVGEVRQPALLIHRRGNHHIPLQVSRELAAQLPDASFLELEGQSEPWIFGHDDYLPRVLEFLSGEPSPSLESSAGVPDIKTILFTDLVGHTEMMSRLGDERGRAVLREHERITREVLAANGGTEVKTMGDGFMASFGSVTRAVECAIALQRAFSPGVRLQPDGAGPGGQDSEPLSVRVGLNAGEPIEEDGDLFGATVILASRIAAKADGGEILVSDNVRSLCSGKGFLFADRGEFVAKGFEEPVRVYEVNCRG